MCTVAAASGAASVRVRHIMSRGWDPWTERPLPEGVRVAYPPDAVHNHLFSAGLFPIPPAEDFTALEIQLEGRFLSKGEEERSLRGGS